MRRKKLGIMGIWVLALALVGCGKKNTIPENIDFGTVPSTTEEVADETKATTAEPVRYRLSDETDEALPEETTGEVATSEEEVTTTAETTTVEETPTEATQVTIDANQAAAVEADIDEVVIDKSYDLSSILGMQSFIDGYLSENYIAYTQAYCAVPAWNSMIQDYGYKDYWGTIDYNDIEISTSEENSDYQVAKVPAEGMDTLYFEYMIYCTNDGVYKISDFRRVEG